MARRPAPSFNPFDALAVPERAPERAAERAADFADVAGGGGSTAPEANPFDALAGAPVEAPSGPGLAAPSPERAPREGEDPSLLQGLRETLAGYAAPVLSLPAQAAGSMAGLAAMMAEAAGDPELAALQRQGITQSDALRQLNYEVLAGTSAPETLSGRVARPTGEVLAQVGKYLAAGPAGGTALVVADAARGDRQAPLVAEGARAAGLDPVAGAIESADRAAPLLTEVVLDELLGRALLGVPRAVGAAVDATRPAARAAPAPAGAVPPIQRAEALVEEIERLATQMDVEHAGRQSVRYRRRPAGVSALPTPESFAGQGQLVARRPAGALVGRDARAGVSGPFTRAAAAPEGVTGAQMAGGLAGAGLGGAVGAVAGAQQGTTPTERRAGALAGAGAGALAGLALTSGARRVADELPLADPRPRAAARSPAVPDEIVVPPRPARGAGVRRFGEVASAGGEIADEAPLRLPERAPSETRAPRARAAQPAGEITWRTWDQSNPVAQSLTARIQRHVQRLGPQLDQARGFQSAASQQAEARRFAREVLADPLALDHAKARKLSGPEIVGLKVVVQENAAVIESASRALARGDLPPDEVRQALAVIEAAERSTDDALQMIVRESSRAGRDLGALRQLAKQSVAPEVWLVKAQRIVGEGTPLSDAVKLEIRRLAQDAADACQGGA